MVRNEAAATAQQQMYSERQAAERLGISPISLFRLRKIGAISHYRVNRRVIYGEDQIRDFLARNERTAKGGCDGTIERVQR
jgi:hypothetical protein